MKQPQPAQPPGLTPAEKEVLDYLVAAWNSFISLRQHTDDDVQAMRDSIHRCQELVALRVARRVDPEIWRVP